MNQDASRYKMIPALAAYIDRIRAKQKGISHFMIEEPRHGTYYEEVCRIKLGRDGSIACSGRNAARVVEYEPTEAEAAAIKAADFTGYFIDSIYATDSKLRELEKKLNLPHNHDSLLQFWEDDRLLMVQQRVERDNAAGKAYIPWTFFADGVWRAVEPDGPLPFWRPHTHKVRSSRKMLWEGGKAARFADNLCNNNDPEWVTRRAQHPWAEELGRYEHWGMIGGALAPHRADYDKLRAEKPEEVVYVCDDDYPGREALKMMSHNYRLSMKGIRIAGFGEGWDIADDMPEHLFKEHNGNHIYVGPQLANLKEPATMATKREHSGERGRPLTVLRPTFAKEWVHAVKPEVFIHVDRPNVFYTKAEFNIMTGPFAPWCKDLARLLQDNNLSGKVDSIDYIPGKRSGLISDNDAGITFNTYVPPNIRQVKGSYQPFTDYMEYLFPTLRDRLLVMKWVATLIACPGVKMKYSLLLIGSQGTGKTTLASEICRPLVGDNNCGIVSESSIVSEWNDWAAHKRLVIVPEIYQGDSRKVNNILKSTITDSPLAVRRRYLDSYHIKNYVHIIASSNEERAIKLDGDDRRWLIPDTTDTLQDKDYWRGFYHWLQYESGLGKILRWAHDFVKEHGAVHEGDHAPDTSQKQQVYQETLSPGERLIYDLLLRIMDRLKSGSLPLPFVTSDDSLVDVVKDRYHDGKNSDKLERPGTLRKLAKKAGFHIGKNRVRYGPQLKRGRLISNDPIIVEYQGTQGGAKDEGEINPWDAKRLWDEGEKE